MRWEYCLRDRRPPSPRSVAADSSARAASMRARRAARGSAPASISDDRGSGIVVLSAVGCLVSEADANEADDLAFLHLAGGIHVQELGRRAENEHVGAAMNVPGAEAARHALERDREQPTDIEEAELVVDRTGFVVVLQAQTDLQRDRDHRAVLPQRPARTRTELEIRALPAPAVSLSLVTQLEGDEPVRITHVRLRQLQAHFPDGVEHPVGTRAGRERRRETDASTESKRERRVEILLVVQASTGSLRS